MSHIISRFWVIEKTQDRALLAGPHGFLHWDVVLLEDLGQLLQPSRLGQL